MLGRQSVLLLLVAISAPVVSVLGQRTVFLPPDPVVEARSSEPTPPLDLDRIAELIHARVNQERVRAGLSELERDRSLEQVGYGHSKNMAQYGYFDHRDLRGRDATRRARESGYLCVASMQDPTPVGVGENLFAGFRYSEYRLTYYPGEIVASFAWKTEDQFAKEVVEAWMTSPPHRANVLHPDYRVQGIGVFLSSSLEIFVTQNLC